MQRSTRHIADRVRKNNVATNVKKKEKDRKITLHDVLLCRLFSLSTLIVGDTIIRFSAATFNSLAVTDTVSNRSIMHISCLH